MFRICGWCRGEGVIPCSCNGRRHEFVCPVCDGDGVVSAAKQTLIAMQSSFVQPVMRPTFHPEARNG